jgi:hypothetical protein
MMFMVCDFATFLKKPAELTLPCRQIGSNTYSKKICNALYNVENQDQNYGSHYRTLLLDLIDLLF